MTPPSRPIASMVSRNKRAEGDLRKLVSGHHEVQLINNSMTEFIVRFHGPKDTPYEGGVWNIIVELPRDYPYKSPSICFQNKMLHPNIDFHTGSVCLDVINQTWSPVFGLINIFDVFLPQLLSYPNAADPLNRDAAILWDKAKKNKSEEYNDAVRKSVKLYADPALFASEKTTTDSAIQSEQSDDDEMSSLDGLSDDD